MKIVNSYYKQRIYRTRYKRNKTVSISNINISIDNLYSLFSKSDGFRRRMESGKYIYNNNRMYISERGAFNRISSRIKQVKIKGYGSFEIKTIKHTINYGQNENISEFNNTGVKIFLTKGTPMINEVGETYGDYLTRIMKRHGIGATELSRLTGIQKKQIDRLRRGDINRPNPDDIIAICVALHLEPISESPHLLKKCRISLDDTNPRDRCLIVFQKILWNYTVSQCNKILIEKGFNAMTQLRD